MGMEMDKGMETGMEKGMGLGMGTETGKGMGTRMGMQKEKWTGMGMGNEKWIGMETRMWLGTEMGSGMGTGIWMGFGTETGMGTEVTMAMGTGNGDRDRGCKGDEDGAAGHNEEPVWRLSRAYLCHSASDTGELPRTPPTPKQPPDGTKTPRTEPSVSPHGAGDTPGPGAALGVPAQPRGGDG